MATGLIDINQTREAKAPNISASGNGITASGGRPMGAPGATQGAPFSYVPLKAERHRFANARK